MGLSTAAVLICANLVISLIRKITPDKIRILMLRMHLVVI
ncbi:Rnf-Nqr domain containing protein [Clostridioides difficile]